MSIRDDLRTKIFSGATNRESITITFFGADIELRQPTVGQLQNMLEEQSNRQGNIPLPQYLIQYAYVPGTDDKVFDQADLAGLMDLPYNQDMIIVANAVGKLSGVNVPVAEKNLTEAP